MIRGRYFLPVMLLFFSGVVNAQFKKGDRMAGASVASVLYNSGSSDVTVASIGNSTSKITTYNINISPLLGWFISDNTAVGVSLNINPTGNKTTYEQNGTTFLSDKSNNFNFGLGGFARHYLHSSGSMIPFGQVSLNAGISNLKTEGFSYNTPGYYKTTYDGSSSGGFFFNATFVAGLTKILEEYTGLDFYIGYAYSYNKNTFKKTTLYYLTSSDTNPSTGKNETTTKFTNHGVLLGVGFQVFLHKRK